MSEKSRKILVLLIILAFILSMVIPALIVLLG
jgi:hypothetical protein